MAHLPFLLYLGDDAGLRYSESRGSYYEVRTLVSHKLTSSNGFCVLTCVCVYVHVCPGVCVYVLTYYTPTCVCRTEVDGYAFLVHSPPYKSKQGSSCEPS